MRNKHTHLWTLAGVMLAVTAILGGRVSEQFFPALADQVCSTEPETTVVGSTVGGNITISNVSMSDVGADAEIGMTIQDPDEYITTNTNILVFPEYILPYIMNGMQMTPEIETLKNNKDYIRCECDEAIGDCDQEYASGLSYSSVPGDVMVLVLESSVGGAASFGLPEGVTCQVNDAVAKTGITSYGYMLMLQNAVSNITDDWYSADWSSVYLEDGNGDPVLNEQGLEIMVGKTYTGETVYADAEYCTLASCPEALAIYVGNFVLPGDNADVEMDVAGGSVIVGTGSYDPVEGGQFDANTDKDTLSTGTDQTSGLEVTEDGYIIIIPQTVGVTVSNISYSANLGMVTTDYTGTFQKADGTCEIIETGTEEEGSIGDGSALTLMDDDIWNTTSIYTSRLDLSNIDSAGEVSIKMEVDEENPENGFAILGDEPGSDDEFFSVLMLMDLEEDEEINLSFAGDAEILAPQQVENAGSVWKKNIERSAKVGSDSGKITLSNDLAMFLLGTTPEDFAGVAYRENVNQPWAEIDACQGDMENISGSDYACYLEEAGSGDSDDILVVTNHFSLFSVLVTNVADGSYTGGDKGFSGKKLYASASEATKKLATLIGEGTQSVQVAAGIDPDQALTITRDGKKVTLASALGTVGENAKSIVAFAVGDTISTSSIAAADVDLGGFTKMHLAENSSVKIESVEGNKIIYGHEKGEVRYAFDKQGTDMTWEVRTEAVNATIRGTEFAVKDLETEEVIELYEGKLEIKENVTGKVFTLLPGDALHTPEGGTSYVVQGEVASQIVKKTIDISKVSFTDVPTSAWYAKYVLELKALGLVNGYANGSYNPAGTANYADTLKLALRASGKTVAGVKDTDSSKKWFETYMSMSEHQDAIPGYTAKFDAYKTITRAAAIRLVMEAMEISPMTNVTAADLFTDVKADAWYASYLAAAKKAGLVSGDSTTGAFRPEAQVNRAELAKMIMEANKL